jgi:hypothetical protein
MINENKRKKVGSQICIGVNGNHLINIY